MESKECYKCGRELPISEFNRSSKNKDGYQSYCKDCQRIAQQSNAKRRAIGRFELPELLDEIKRRGVKLIKPMSPREMMQALAEQGYKGTLTFTKVETININEL